MTSSLDVDLEPLALDEGDVPEEQDGGQDSHHVQEGDAQDAQTRLPRLEPEGGNGEEGLARGSCSRRPRAEVALLRLLLRCGDDD